MKFKSMELNRAPFWRKPVILLATGFGLGLSPAASGTTGTLLGLPIMLALSPIWARALTAPTIAAQAFAALILIVLAVPICDKAEKHFGRKDDGRIVADEFMTFPVGLAFFTNRFFDVLKPFPAHRLQRLTGGLGIVADDVVAALYSLLINHVVYYLALR